MPLFVLVLAGADGTAGLVAGAVVLVAGAVAGATAWAVAAWAGTAGTFVAALGVLEDPHAASVNGNEARTR